MHISQPPAPLYNSALDPHNTRDGRLMCVRIALSAATNAVALAPPQRRRGDSAHKDPDSGQREAGASEERRRARSARVRHRRLAHRGNLRHRYGTGVGGCEPGRVRSAKPRRAVSSAKRGRMKA